MTTGYRMKLRRKEIGVSVEDIANTLGVSIATVYRYEKGEIEKVPGALLEPLARALRTTPAYLMGWEEAPKRTGTEIKDIIRSRRNELGYSLEELAQLVGVSKQTVQKWESGKISNLKHSNIAALSAALNVPIEVLLGWEEPDATAPDLPGNILPLPKTRKIPLLGTIACGEPITAVENVDQYIDVAEGIHCTFALRCKGDSMIDARIMDGDVVYIREQPQVENGEIAAVLIDDEATLKRVYISDGVVQLVACNVKYAPLVYSGERLEQLRILGKAVAFTSLVR